MYRFQVSAHTQVGESIGIVGSIPELGLWDITQAIRLQTNGDRYPLWWADIEVGDRLSSNQSTSVSPATIEYQYVRFSGDGRTQWESAVGLNRWVPIETPPPDNTMIVEDGWFGHVQPWPYGYLQHPVPQSPAAQAQGLKVVVLGSSVGLGCSAWMLRGWAWQLEQVLRPLGHQLVNVSVLGANVSTTIDRFPLVVAPERPDIVIVALSLGNEGLAYCPPHQRRAIQRRFESGLLQLVKMVKELGARPVLGGVYPHGDYTPEHTWLLRETHQRMLSWGVPVLNWLDGLDNGQGCWRTEYSFDAAHPNTAGHRLMFEAIDLNLFQTAPTATALEKHLPQQQIPVFRDDWGFHLFVNPDEASLRIINTSKHTYTIAMYWDELQSALRHTAHLTPGIYIAKTPQAGILPSFYVQADGAIETLVDVPADTDLEYSPAFNFFAPSVSHVLFYDGHLALLREGDRALRVINESDHEYNIHPMWKEVRSALKEMPSAVYDDPLNPDLPFRTVIIGKDGLESRFKVPAKSSVLFQYTCEVSQINRVAILPLGDRCAARMLLYKMEYDGPAFPFDLTRTTLLSDVADIIETGFEDMWNPAFLYYSSEAGRIYHTKWTGLSFAHEVEETDDPINDMSPVHERMRTRYSARAQRFWHTLNNADKILFIRTGVTNHGSVVDLVHKLTYRCQGKPFHLMLISPQSSQEFYGIPNVLHYDLEFNPDRMYEDEGHWWYCTDVMRHILNSLGISSKNLFWCPPNPRRN